METEPVRQMHYKQKRQQRRPNLVSKIDQPWAPSILVYHWYDIQSSPIA